MKTYSDKMPDSIEIINMSNGYAEVLLAESITQINDGYGYDLYRFAIPCRDNLYDIIANNIEEWLKFAKGKENQVYYTEEQLLQQEITELTLENIEQGQAITDLELMILEG